MKRLKRPPSGTPGWIVVAVAIVAADLADERTMSDVFREAAKRPVAGPCLLVFWTALTAHLFGWIPLKYDPIHQLFMRAGRGRNSAFRELR